MLPQKLTLFRYKQEIQQCLWHAFQALLRDLIPALVLSNKTCLARVTYGFIFPPNDKSDDLHDTGTSREELPATSPRDQSCPHSPLFNMWVVSPLSAELVCCDIPVSDGRVSSQASPALLSHRALGLRCTSNGKGGKILPHALLAGIWWAKG